MWAAKHCSRLFSSGQNRLCVFTRVCGLTKGLQRRQDCLLDNIGSKWCSIVSCTAFFRVDENLCVGENPLHKSGQNYSLFLKRDLSHELVSQISQFEICQI